tara:strand:+ start:2044 stop:2190 length:147 start_codon:yes stop_codon:yes gene_type:complete
MNGKGDKRRPENNKKYRENYNKAFNESKTLKAIKQLKKEWTMSVLGDK